jgi:hypothetical protein
MVLQHQEQHRQPRLIEGDHWSASRPNAATSSIGQGQAAHCVSSLTTVTTTRTTIIFMNAKHAVLGITRRFAAVD